MDETDDETTLDEGTAEDELPTLELSIETEDELDGTTGVTRAWRKRGQDKICQ